MNGLHAIQPQHHIFRTNSAAMARRMAGLPTYDEDKANGIDRVMRLCSCYCSYGQSRHFHPLKHRAANWRCPACLEGQHQ